MSDLSIRPAVRRDELSTAKRRLIEHLKRRDSATATELAAAFGLTDTALRQHLDALQSMGLVERMAMPAQGRGRPPQHWRLTAGASSLFPDGHGDLTLELIDSVREALGDEGLGSVVRTRADRQVRSYAGVVPQNVSLSTRVQVLAEIRTAEGYLAEALVDGDDVLLVEHHCPIGGAARACEGICDAELNVFQQVLGGDVRIARETHLMAGDRRCTYRVTYRETSGDIDGTSA